MILIITEEFELSTCDVLEWINYLGGEAIRIPGDVFFDPEQFQVKVSCTNEEEDVLLVIKGRTIRLADVKSVWFRRDTVAKRPDFLRYIKGDDLRRSLKNHAFQEVRIAKEFIYYQLMSRPYIGNPIKKKIDKFFALRAARKNGLDVPATLVTDNKKALQAFRDKHGAIINKAISDSDFFETEDGKTLISYTNKIDEEILEQMDDTFMPTLAQECLDKDIEIRTFYLFGKCYSMAIFSQLDKQTSVDFRRYNIHIPNRNVPYKLGAELERKIDAFMNEMGLNTGSLDFVKTTNGRMVFLEVNPVGQFGMTSKPCNYNLEKIIASYLVAN